MRQKMKRLMGILLSLAQVLGLMPGMSLTAYADDDPLYAQYKNTTTVITFDGNSWYLIDYDDTTVTLLSEGCVASSQYNESGSFVEYSSNPTVKTAVVNWYKDNITADAKKAVSGNAMFLLTTEQANTIYSANPDVLKCSKATGADYNGWWLCSQGFIDYFAAFVDGGFGYVNDGGSAVDRTLGVRPALKLNLSSVIFSSESKTFSLKPSHTHRFTYAASGATITATCGAEGCTLPEVEGKPTATLTIAASGGTYDGTTAYGATITDTYSIKGEAKVQYQKKTGGSYGIATETAPKDAGDYKASITVGGATASVEYAIAQADSTANAPTGLTAIYGQTLADVSLEGKNPEGNTLGTWTWVDSTQSVGDVVTPAATFKATFTPDSSNYKTVENVDVSVTVGKAANPATVTSTATVTKGGNTVDLAGNVKKNGATGDISYAISGATGGCSLNGSVLTSGDTTGTVTVNVTVAADSNYEALAATPITVTVSDKGTQTITADDVTATFGDTDKAVSASVTDPASGGGAISYAVKDGSENYISVASDGKLTILAVPPTDGKAYVTVTAAETEAYAQATMDVTVTISPKAIAVSSSGYTGDYDKQPHGITVTVTDPASGATVKYGTVEGTYDLDASPTQTEVGSKTVYYQVTAENYTTNTGSATVTINPKGSSGTPGEKTLVYNGTAQELVTAGVAEGGTMMYALGTDAATAPTEGWSVAIPTGMKAGNYYVWYMVKGDANHNDTKPACVEATIAKKDLTVTAEAKSKTQGEADSALTYTAEGLVAGDTLTGALSREAGEDPGTYQITLGSLTAGDNYEITFIPATLTIKEAPAPAPDPGPAPAPAPAPAPSGGGYYGGGTVQNQRRDAYSDVIGAAATNCWDSSPERIHNTELACEKLDGIILQPGEVFSFNEALGGLTAEAGFAVAPVNPDDEATAEMGGGVSQVASTLYTGSLFALLETVERTNHPFAVPFIQPGTDAYVTDPGNADALDLKFRNTRGEPIRISAKTRVDEARQVREIVIELRSALGSSDYMPIRFDNTWGGDQNAFLTETPYDLTRPGYRILLTHEEQAFTDDRGAGIRTLTHRKILDAAGMLVRDEILNSKLPDGSYAMDTYYQG